MSSFCDPSNKNAKKPENKEKSSKTVKNQGKNRQKYDFCAKCADVEKKLLNLCVLHNFLMENVEHGIGCPLQKRVNKIYFFKKSIGK